MPKQEAIRWSSNKLATVVSVLVCDPSGDKVWLGERQGTPNEERHLQTVSTITRGVPRKTFNQLAGGNPLFWRSGAHPLPPRHRNPVRIGYGDHDKNADTMAVEWALGKAGLTEALATREVRGFAVPVLRSLSMVPDAHTEVWEKTAMLHYAFHLDEESDMGALPPATKLYEPLDWVSADKVPSAVAQGEAYLLGGAFARSFACAGGACLNGAGLIIGQGLDQSFQQ